MRATISRRYRVADLISGWLLSTRFHSYFLSMAFVAAFLLRLWAYLPSRTTPLAWDGDSYLHIATGPLDQAFTGDKPFLVPMLYRLLGVNVELMAAFQFLLSVLAWDFLAWRVGALLGNTRLRLLAVCVVLGLSTTSIVAYWDRSVLSESASISLLAMMLGLGFWLSQGWHAGRAATLVLLGFLWGFTRDTNAYLLVLAALLIGGAVLFKRLPKCYLIVAAGFVLVFGASMWNADVAQRWKYPLLDVVSQRILTRPDATAFFTERGMPVSDALIERAGGYADGGNFAYFRDPRLADFRDWLQRSGKSTYLAYLATHPLWLLTAPTPDFPIILSTPDIANYKPLGMAEPPLSGLFAPVGLPALLLALVAVSATAASVLLRRRARGPLLSYTMPMLVLLAAFACAYVSWHGDDMEVERHSVQAGLLLRMGLWLLLLFAVGNLTQLRWPRRDSAS